MKFKAYLQGFFQYKDLLKELVARDIKIRYRRSFFGLLWTLLNPLLMMVVMTVVFSFMFKNSIENFPIYYLSGYIIYQFVTESSTNGLTAIIGNAPLIKKVYIPKYLFPVSKVVSSLVNLAFSYVALVIVMLVTQTPFHATMFLSIIPIFTSFVFTMGLSLLLSAVTVFFRDIEHFYKVITLAWMYLTPLFYPISLLPEWLQNAELFNPIYQNVLYMRLLILEGQLPDLFLNLISFVTAFAMLIIGLIVFYKKQDQYILHV